MSSEKDFEDLRVHFSDRQWNKLKDVEKIIYLNQKSNHLFKLSVGLASKVPEFMRKPTPKPKKKKRSDDDEWIDSDEDSDDPADPPPVKKSSTVIPSERNLRIRTNVVDYTEPTQMDWFIASKQQLAGGSTAVKIYHQEIVTEEVVLDRRLRNRTNVIKYTEEPEDDRGTDQEASTPQPSDDEEDEEEWEESENESIPSDEESGPTDQKTSAPLPSEKKKRRRKEESDDEHSIPSDEESGDTTENVKAVSPRVSLLRLSVDSIKDKMRQCN